MFIRSLTAHPSLFRLAQKKEHTVPSVCHELEASRRGEEITDILMINLATDGKSRGEMTVSILKKSKSNYRTF